MSRANRYLFIALVLCPSVAGCSGSKKSATAPVSGTVTYNGVPVEGATVIFSLPMGGRPATATTDAQGKFQLSTFGDHDGAPPGDYKVTVTKETTTGAESNLTYEQMSELQAKGDPVPGPETKNALPAKYANVTTTDVDLSVKPGANDFLIELKD